MAYRFEIVRFPVIRCELDYALLTYQPQHAEIVDSGTIDHANDSGYRRVMNVLAFHADHKRNGFSGIPPTFLRGYCYQVRWINKPRAKRFHNLFRNVFAAE